MNLIKYLILELTHQKRFCILFIINIALGLSGLLTVESFKTSIHQHIQKQSKNLLGADLQISGRRPINQKEENILRQHLGEERESTFITEMYSMLANPLNAQSRLTQIRAIQKNYPFYGSIKLSSGSDLQISGQEDLNQIWLYPELLNQLGLELGQEVRLGDAIFRIEDTILDDASSGITTSMAPRAYISYSNLQKTHLLRPGSIATYKELVKLPPSLPSSELKNLRNNLFNALPTPDLRISTHENSSQQMSRLMQRLNDFLGLCSLVSLFLASLGAAFLFRSYLRSRIKGIAILRSIGLNSSASFYYYLGQLIILATLSTLFAAVISHSLIQVFPKLIGQILPFKLQAQLSLSGVFFCWLIACLSSFTLCLPTLAGIKSVKINQLFGDATHSQSLNFEKQLFSSIPSMLFFWGLAVYLSKSWSTGSYFTLLFFICALALSGVSLLLSHISQKLPSPSLSLKFAIRDISRKKVSTISIFMCLGLGMVLLNIIPQLQTSINEELKSPESSKIPSLFLFDIQEEQIGELKEILGEHQTQFSQISPMIRSRLSKVNGESFDKGTGAYQKNLSREQEREMRFRNRGFNLSYRKTLIDSEKIIRGDAINSSFDPGIDDIAKISLEKRFAKRLGLKIGDVLEFDIESVPITAKVVNLRQVQWTSFQPNFFIQFQEGVLEEAPKTFLATIPGIQKEKLLPLQKSIVQKLPNISIIDVSRLVQKIREVITQMGLALRFMTGLTLFSGLLVLYSIANHQARSRRKEYALLKALGSPFEIIRRQNIWQYTLICLGASLLGVLFSLAISYAFSVLLLEGTWAYDPTVPVISIVLLLLLAIVITDLATRSALKEKTQQLFAD